MGSLEVKLIELGELFLAAMDQSLSDQGTSDAGGDDGDDQDGGEDSGDVGASPSGSMRPETPVLRKVGLVEQMESEAREAELGG